MKDTAMGGWGAALWMPIRLDLSILVRNNLSGSETGSDFFRRRIGKGFSIKT